ncbi:MAG: amidohydrolase family protein [Proteobacteria bacterium]|nr:amidohydrolase family protein [Pseudomonadota bacterium]MBW3616594.1 amidohydrolase family protein [Pseudomonadota bacterium]
MLKMLAGSVAAAALLTGGAAAQPAAGPQQVTVIHAGALLDRPGRPPRGPSTLIVREGKVAEIRDGHLTPEPGARVIDLRSKFVLPGLIDSHVHIFNDDDKLQARLQANNRDIEDNFVVGVDNARRTLEAGFTTVRDLGSDPRSVTALRDGINRGLLAGPTIVPAGRGVSITSGHGDAANNLNRDAADAARARADNLCNGPEDCRRAVREQISKGAEVIKFMATGGVNSDIAGGLNQQMFPDEMKAIVDTAHIFGRKVAVHAHGADGIKAALEAGADSIEHGSYTDEETNAVFKRRGAYLVPTMLAPRAALAQARAGARNPNSLAKAEEVNKVASQNWARAIRSGVKIAFGTDNGVGAHGTNGQEFKLMVEAGMTPAAAIQAATVNAADLLGRSDRIGTLEPGRDADIIGVDRSPLTDVTELERVGFVMRRGVVHKLDGRRQGFPPE